MCTRQVLSPACSYSACLSLFSLFLCHAIQTLPWPEVPATMAGGAKAARGAKKTKGKTVSVGEEAEGAAGLRAAAPTSRDAAVVVGSDDQSTRPQSRREDAALAMSRAAVDAGPQSYTGEGRTAGAAGHDTGRLASEGVAQEQDAELEVALHAAGAKRPQEPPLLEWGRASSERRSEPVSAEGRGTTTSAQGGDELARRSCEGLPPGLPSKLESRAPLSPMSTPNKRGTVLELVGREVVVPLTLAHFGAEQLTTIALALGRTEAAVMVGGSVLLELKSVARMGKLVRLEREGVWVIAVDGLQKPLVREVLLVADWRSRPATALPIASAGLRGTLAKSGNLLTVEWCDEAAAVGAGVIHLRTKQASRLVTPKQKRNAPCEPGSSPGSDRKRSRKDGEATSNSNRRQLFEKSASQ